MAKLEIRCARENDIAKLIRVDREAFLDDWPKELLLTEDYFKTWLEVFPEGFFVASLDDKPVGYAAVEIIEHNIENPIPSWYKATDNGFIRRTHNPSGNTVYGVSIAVSRRCSIIRVGKKLMESAIKKFIRNRNLRYGVVGSRVPGYYKAAKQMTIEEYVYAKRRNRQAIDPLVAFYQRCGFRIVKILPNYIEDPFSQNYGVLMVLGLNELREINLSKPNI